MKKIRFVLLLLAVTALLTSCQVNWFGDTREVAWYYVVVPIVLIAFLGYAILMSRTYICPQCKAEFKAKPYQLYVMVHMGGKRIAKCPKCGRKGFCRIKR